jgi:hypothetical protein
MLHAVRQVPADAKLQRFFKEHLKVGLRHRSGILQPVAQRKAGDEERPKLIPKANIVESDFPVGEADAILCLGRSRCKMRKGDRIERLLLLT